MNGTTLDIEPSSASSVDGAKQFQNVRVQFAGSGKSISSLTDLDDRGSLQRVWLEPELISSVTGTERAKRKVIGFSDLPPHLVKAITVTEDRSFFEHYGVNIRGIIRALHQTLRFRSELADCAPGWLEHHAAARQEPFALAGTDVAAQDQRSLHVDHSRDASE